MKRLKIGILIALMAFITVHIVLPRVVTLEFNKRLWDFYPKYRYAMSHSLAFKINSKQMDHEEVIDLIGKPIYGYESNHFTYHLRSNGLFGLDSDWIDIEFLNDSTKAYVYNVD